MHFHIWPIRTSHMLPSMLFPILPTWCKWAQHAWKLHAEKGLTSRKKPGSLNRHLEDCCPPVGPLILDFTQARKKLLLRLKHYICWDLYVTAPRATLRNTPRKVVGLRDISAWVSSEKFRVNYVNITLSSCRESPSSSYLCILLKIVLEGVITYNKNSVACV